MRHPGSTLRMRKASQTQTIIQVRIGWDEQRGKKNYENIMNTYIQLAPRIFVFSYFL